MNAAPTTAEPAPLARRRTDLAASELDRTVAEVLARWPSAGLAAGIVLDDRLAWFHGHGVGDTGTRRAIGPDTVFRIGSITKTFTAIAVLQLCEQGLVDLDDPANRHLRAFELVPADPRLPPATVRHLLTHTAGIGYWRRLSDLLRPGYGSGVQTTPPVPSLAEYYRRGLPIEVAPGTRWVYSNHGFATLGQLVEDVSGVPLDRYLREHLFGPLGMERTDLVRSDRLGNDVATGYVLRSRGLVAVDERDPVTTGASAAYATAADLARYASALLGGGANREGRVLAPATMALMFEPQVRTDPRIPGMGLGFLLDDLAGHRTAGHDGTMAGFLTEVVVAPDDGIGVVALTNTGALDARGAAEPVASALLRRLLGLPPSAIRTDLAPRPERWDRLCGWYGFDPGPITNLFTHAVMGAGIEVAVRRGQLILMPATPVPAMRRGLPLHPDDPYDPDVFRVDLSAIGKGTVRVVFDAEPGSTASRLCFAGMSFPRRPGWGNPAPWLRAGLVAGTAAYAMRRARHRHPSQRSRPGGDPP
jgi:CubicO group peptidase (beta-lactamase class C family)